MKKIVAIAGTEYSMKSSAYTQFKYKNDTGRKFLDDLQKIAKLLEVSEEEQISNFDNLTEIILRIAYVMIEEADDEQVNSFEDFLKRIDGLYDETDWVKEVVEIATSPFSRKLQTNQINRK